MEVGSIGGSYRDMDVLPLPSRIEDELVLQEKHELSLRSTLVVRVVVVVVVVVVRVVVVRGGGVVVDHQMPILPMPMIVHE
jgi:hypothetical protein